MARVTRYDKATLGPGSGRARGLRGWMRWHRRFGGEPVKIKNPDKYLNSYARLWKGVVAMLER